MVVIFFKAFHSRKLCVFIKMDICESNISHFNYSHTCITRSDLGQRKSGLIKEVQFILNFLCQEKKKGDLLIQVTSWTGLTVLYTSSFDK